MLKKTKMLIHNIEQKTPEWYKLRQQYPLTASNAQAIGNNGKGLETLVWEQLAAKYSATEADQYSNKDLERGVELEPQARSLYELETGNEVKSIGFVTNEAVSKSCGASPDGFVGDNGIVEIKAFEDKKHFRLSLEDDYEIESQYRWQIQAQLLICEREWCDFVAYNPNYKKSLVIKRVLPDKEMQDKLKAGFAIGEELIRKIENKIK
jgi:exodeoxyribonuclease (lambda-induced)